ncbi:MAG: hypothetical protein RQ990_06830 [Candidatus Hydrothermia bacterium]|nr:hypothetical protein [Candidatus Hydrothermia bacterium]
MMLLLVVSNIDSVYNFLVKSLKLNTKTTTYKVDTIGINLYQFSIRTADKKQNPSKIAESLKKLNFELKDSLYFGKILSNEVKDLKLSSNKDTIFISFTIKIIPPALVFKEEKILNFLLNTIENSTNVKIEKKLINKELQTKSDFYEFKIVFKPQKNNKFSQDDITKIKNFLLRENIYAMDYQLGKLVYVKFSGLIEGYIVYDSYIKFLDDSLLAQLRIKKPELKTVRIASQILEILKSISKDKVIGFGINQIGQDLIDNKLVSVIKLDIIMRKDVDFEEIRNSIIDKGSKISSSNNAYVVSGVIVISNPILNSEKFKTIRIEFEKFSDYDIYKITTANIEVQ